MSRQSELREHVEKVMGELGIARPYRFGTANNTHQQVEFHHHGIKVKYQFPGTYSDHRVFKNIRTSLKQRLRSAEGLAVSGDAVRRSVLDAGRMLSRQPHHLGAGGAGAYRAAPSVHHSRPSSHHKAS